MARMEQAIQNIVDMFVEYADGDGKLNKEELRKMMEKEIQNPEIKAKICAVDLDKIMERMDRNRDGEVNFREFVKCVVFMAKCLYRKKTGRCQEDED
ncbi:protein S100-A1-like isoform X1 [Lates japonicus]|uniref:Protein S100-A1-like isoform X1 n=1 Tax=Lates japonicus TaxID=270547 RepID=A0AAD3N0P1_LATJO|nr:protein S100-A1-like isoform X1 [Lates japonicus]